MKDFIEIFLKKWPFSVENNNIYPQKREEEIEKCSNFDVKNQKFFAWKMLEEGCKKLGFDFEKITFFQEKNKWKCDDFCFSISHSGSIVAVAISSKNIGIDIEKVDYKRFEKFSENKFLTEKEKINIKKSGEVFNRLWTVKEAIFKLGGYEGFNPSKVESSAAFVETKILSDGKENFYLSVAVEDEIDAGYHLDDSISEISD